jgi:hypothetical protein
LGLHPEPDEALLVVTTEDFRKGRSHRFGKRNPEQIDEPFWDRMIRAGISAYQAEQLFADEVPRSHKPVWCAQRFGQSMTFLPDGRVLQVGGEHEDSYMKDFCIYNDVFLHELDGTIRIFGYPESVFPPTDFHTATLVGGDIFIIGSAGYEGMRQYGVTPVYRLSTKTLRMDAVEARGDAPGWIYNHRAIRHTEDEIRIFAGTRVTWDGKRETDNNNEQSFILYVKRLIWRRTDLATDLP